MERAESQGRVIIVRDEAQDLAPVDLGPLFAAERGRLLPADPAEDGVEPTADAAGYEDSDDRR